MRKPIPTARRRASLGGTEPHARFALAEFKTKSEAVADLLERDIVSGAFLPGARLGQDELARRYRVSTTPVREALRTLEIRGLATFLPHRGHVVATRSADELGDILYVREIVEAKLAKRAASELTDDDLDRLAELESEMRSSLTSRARYQELNDQFHGMIYRASGQETLVETAKRLRSPLLAPLLHYLKSGVTLVTLHSEHRGILEAARARDGHRLEALTRAHIVNLRSAVIPYLSGRKGRAAAKEAQA